MVYALLPNKTETTYIKLMQMVATSVKVEPKSITCDFEKAMISAIQDKFKTTHVHGCFFHLSQSLFRNVQTKGLSEHFNNNKQFRDSFHFLQALAFVPPSFVVDAFAFIKQQCPAPFKLMCSYFEQFYIGRLKRDSKTFRDVPWFPIELWNVYDRVLQNLPRTNNSIESWHHIIANDQKKHLSFEKIIELFRIEQKNTELVYSNLSTGGEHKRKKDSLAKDICLYNVVKEFDFDKKKLPKYLSSIAKNLNI